MPNGNALNIHTAGLVAFNGTGTFSGRTLQAGANTTITNGDGIAGDPVIAFNGSGSTSASSVLDFVDDFIDPMNFGSAGGTSLWWRITGSGTSTSVVQGANIDSSHPGVITMDTGSISTGKMQVMLGATSTTLGSLILGGGVVTCQWFLKIPVLSNGTDTFTIRMGLGDTANAAQANGTYFEYTHGTNSGNWQIVNASASSRNTANTSTAADTSYHNFKIVVNAAASSVAYYIDNVQVANSPNTSQIPTLQIAPFASIVKSLGSTASELYLDLCTLNIVLTTPR